MRHPFDGPVSDQPLPTRRAALGHIAALAVGAVGVGAARAGEASTEKIGPNGEDEEGGGGRRMTNAKAEAGMSSRGLNEEGGYPQYQIQPRPQPVDLKVEQMEVLWNDLADAAKARTGVYQLVSAKQVVPFLKERLQPADQPKPGQIDQLIVDLDDGTFATRQKATTALEKIGLPAVGPMQKALDARPTLEVRRRIEGILAGIQKLRVQAQHAIQVLSLHGTAEAMGYLVSLSQGAKDSVLTTDANAAVAMMGHYCWNAWAISHTPQPSPLEQLQQLKLKQLEDLPRKQDRE